MEIKNDSITRVRDEVRARSGQDVSECLQCARCSAGCPVWAAMDILPHQVIRLLQLGDVQGAADSKTPWICASCFSCEARCPRELDLARIMEGVRHSVLRQKGTGGLNPGLAADSISLQKRGKIPQQALVSAFRKLTR